MIKRTIQIIPILPIYCLTFIFYFLGKVFNSIEYKLSDISMSYISWLERKQSN